MSKKDYELIARVMRCELEAARGNDEPHGVIALESAARLFARSFAALNERFDGHRFLAACGVEV